MAQKSVMLTNEEFELIEEIRKLPHGRIPIVVFVEKNQPVRIVIEKVFESKIL